MLDGLSFPVHLIHSEKNCSTCPVTGGGDVYIDRLKEVRSFGDRLGLDCLSIKNVGKVPSLISTRKVSHSGLGRRAFFRSMWGGARKVPLMALESLLNTGPEQEQGITELPGLTVDRLEFLKRALAPVNSDVQLTFLQQPFLQQTCHYCRACVVLCPVGALKCEVGDDYRLLLHQDLCTGCGLCTQVCYHQSLGLAPATVAGMKKEEPLVLALGRKKSCSTCGQEMIVSGPVEECFICQKKALLDVN
ncbi:MAG TPA: 4Fe-4S dicluster domain-containing protein [Clostridia bacterium]|nr:4Fe-4S dicluster domain-containing protein [Clostridia bacterium]